MGGCAAGKKRKMAVKVSSFIPGWLDKAIDGHKVSVWLKPDPEKKGKATNKHQENLNASQTNPEFHQVDNSAPKIIDGLKKMQELNKKQNAKKEAVLVSQVHYTAAMMYHGAGRLVVDCQADLMPTSSLTVWWPMCTT